jgi:hypothetical protein
MDPVPAAGPLVLRCVCCGIALTIPLLHCRRNLSYAKQATKITYREGTLSYLTAVSSHEPKDTLS